MPNLREMNRKKYKIKNLYDNKFEDHYNNRINEKNPRALKWNVCSI